MITFSNGHKFDFGTASGAMSFNGDGWWFEQPARLLGHLRPEEFTIIIKTLTYKPRAGNLRWWAPWRAVKLIPNGGVVNSVGLTNPGFQWWCDKPYKHVVKRGYKAIVSFMPEDAFEAALMAETFNKLDSIVGVQINVSCPNVARDGGVSHICRITDVVSRRSRHPVTLKLSYQDDYIQICKNLDGQVEAFELINTVPFGSVYPEVQSPLAKYGYAGGVSGRPIRRLAEEALSKVKEAGVRTPVISGGGIESLDDVLRREKLGAEGFVFGSVFIRDATLPNKIVKEYRRTD